MNPSPCQTTDPAKTSTPRPRRRRNRPGTGHDRLHLLIVDDEPDVLDALDAALPADDLRISQALTCDQARHILATDPADLALIDIRLPDGDGLELAGEITEQRPACQILVMTAAPTAELAVRAMRIGARDFLAKPIDLDELNRRIAVAVHRRHRALRRRRRYRRLKRLVRRLDHDRRDISDQIDILCKDLVGAYQDMACQLQLMEKVGEFKAVIRGELDLEQVLRLCLQFLLEQLGPTNAVIFLPGSTGGFAVGGYVNYSHQDDEPTVLLDHLADVLAPRIAEEPEPVHLAGNDVLETWLGDDAAWLADCCCLAVPCRDGQRTLAAMLLYRDADQPFTDDQLKLMHHVGAFFGRHLGRIVRVHHRLSGFFDDEQNPWQSDPDLPWNGDDDDPDPCPPF